METRSRRSTVVLGLVLMMSCAVGVCCAGGVDDDPPAVYRPADPYPVLDELRKIREAQTAEQETLRCQVDRRYAAEAKRQKAQARKLRLDWSVIDKPRSPESFDSAFHFNPVPQYATGTCWAFCSTSFFESEVQRQTGREIKLSEMWTVYWEFVEKARRFVREYGHSHFSSGSQDSGTREIYRRYGIVPAAAYAGILSTDGRHDHSLLVAELRDYLVWVKEKNRWNEDKVIRYVRDVLDRFLGPPPEVFDYEGRSYTPQTFLSTVLGLAMADYVTVVSTMKEPFGSWIVLDFPDNWRRRIDFLNLPLDDFYSTIKSAVRDGYTVSVGGDVSEPGLDGLEDAAFIPHWDIPAEHIDQASREFRIANKTTGDDHGIHIVGYQHHGGRDWFLIKDSNRSSRLGRFKGYYFYTGDYIRLKMLSFMVHRDRLAGLIPG